MADVNEALLNDLLTRVQKLESNNTAKHDHTEINDYLATLDRVAFSMTVAIDVISKVLIDKNLTTKEELNKMLEEERDKVVKEIQGKVAEQKK